MKKLIPLAASIALILVAGIFASAGILAQFHDEETVSVADINAGTLDLTVNDQNPCTIHVTIPNIKPGDTIRLGYTTKNIGNLDGVISVEISDIVNKENGRNEPEIAAGDTYGPLKGELGEYLMVTAMTMGGTGQTAYGVTSLQKWYAMRPATLNDVGGDTYILEPPRADPTDKILESGDEMNFAMTLELPSATGNIVQSDSVEFDIIFHLDQA